MGRTVPLSLYGGKDDVSIRTFGERFEPCET